VVRGVAEDAGRGFVTTGHKMAASGGETIASNKERDQVGGRSRRDSGRKVANQGRAKTQGVVIRWQGVKCTILLLFRLGLSSDQQ
jgi:hypothetical protein